MRRGRENCAWEAGTEARVPGGGVRGSEAEWMEGSGGFVSPGDQSAEASQAVPEPAHALTLAWPARGTVVPERPLRQ